MREHLSPHGGERTVTVRTAGEWSDARTPQPARRAAGTPSRQIPGPAAAAAAAAVDQRSTRTVPPPARCVRAPHPVPLPPTAESLLVGRCLRPSRTHGALAGRYGACVHGFGIRRQPSLRSGAVELNRNRPGLAGQRGDARAPRVRPHLRNYPLRRPSVGWLAHVRADTRVRIACPPRSAAAPPPTARSTYAQARVRLVRVRADATSADVCAPSTQPSLSPPDPILGCAIVRVGTCFSAPLPPCLVFLYRQFARAGGTRSGTAVARR